MTSLRRARSAEGLRPRPLRVFPDDLLSCIEFYLDVRKKLWRQSNPFAPRCKRREEKCAPGHIAQDIRSGRTAAALRSSTLIRGMSFVPEPDPDEETLPVGIGPVSKSGPAVTQTPIVHDLDLPRLELEPLSELGRLGHPVDRLEGDRGLLVERPPEHGVPLADEAGREADPENVMDSLEHRLERRRGVVRRVLALAVEMKGLEKSGNCLRVLLQ